MRSNRLLYSLETHQTLGITVIQAIFAFSITSNSWKLLNSEFSNADFVAGLQRYAGGLNVPKPGPLDSSRDTK